MPVSVDLLRRLPFLRAVPPEGLAEVAGSARAASYLKGEVVVPRFHAPDAVVGFLEGLAKLSGVSPNGYERTLWLFRPGEVAGARAILGETRESNFEIVALSPLRVIQFPRAELLAIGEKHPDLLLDLTREFAQRLASMEKRLLAAMATEVRVRLARLLLDLVPRGNEKANGLVPLVWPLTHREMSQIVGASRPHISAMVAELEGEGCLKREGPRSIRVNPACLAKIVAEEM